MASPKNMLLTVCANVGLPAFGRKITRKSFLMLMLHGITDRQHQGLENCDGKHLHVDRLKVFLDELQRHHHLEKLETVLEMLASGEKLPPNTVVITFDDGYRSNYCLAFPELKKRSIPASIFLATEFVDEKVPLWTDRLEFALNQTELPVLNVDFSGQRVSFPLETLGHRLEALKTIKRRFKLLPMESLAKKVVELEVQMGCSLLSHGLRPSIYQSLEWGDVTEMKQSGLISFGVHTHTHKILSRCATDLARSEITYSREVIRDRTGEEPLLFCYPNGLSGDFNELTTEMLREEGFSCGITTMSGWNRVDANPYELKRIAVCNDWSLTYFQLVVSGTIACLKGSL